MKQQSKQLPTRIDAGGVCIQAKDWSELDVARFRLPKGLDGTLLFRGLPDNRCQCPHWGTVLRGSIHVTYADGSEEVAYADEVYYWPAGHTVRVDEDFEAIAFQPECGDERADRSPEDPIGRDLAIRQSAKGVTTVSLKIVDRNIWLAAACQLAGRRAGDILDARVRGIARRRARDREDRRRRGPSVGRLPGLPARGLRDRRAARRSIKAERRRIPQAARDVEIPLHTHTSAERMILVAGELHVKYEGRAPPAHARLVRLWAGRTGAQRRLRQRSALRALHRIRVRAGRRAFRTEASKPDHASSIQETRDATRHHRRH